MQSHRPLIMNVREGGLEPPHLSAYAPETYASTNSATPALVVVCFSKAGAKVEAVSIYPNSFSFFLKFALKIKES